MKRLKFLFGIHNHQPVGNFDHVFEELYQNCYRPYLEVLRDFPRLKTSVHFTGPLLEWIKNNHSDLLKQIKDMVAEGRLEIISGGFYEPLLSFIPEEDALGQIRMMNDFIRAEFDFSPRGLWLAERVWNPDLPRIISAAGLEYTILDDTHFYYAGLEEKQISGYFITEKLGSPLNVFPISKTLRYSVPFDLPEKTLAHLRRYKDELGFDGVTYADDGEKFGGWPETYKWVYEENYLRRFFASLQDNEDWIETLTFGEYLDRSGPTSRIYLPMASYDEMMEWSLPAPAAARFHNLKTELKEKGFTEEQYRIFLRGGQWDNFLTKYEESNHLHKKMLHVSRKLARFSGDAETVEEARRELYRGQCNCAQWHGLFGGLYLNYLRHALYAHLIAAENILDGQALGEGTKLQVEIVDFNMDGYDEVLVSNSKMNVYIMPAYGGAVFEIDYRPARFNILNVFRRQLEAYHRDINVPHADGNKNAAAPKSIHDKPQSGEEGLQDYLVYDRWQRYSFIDHFLGPETTLESFKKCQHPEEGDFAGQPYSIISPGDPKPGKENFIYLERNGSIRKNDVRVPVALRKTFEFSPSEAEFEVLYKVTNEGDENLDLWFGVEFNLTLLAKDSSDRYYSSKDHRLEDANMASEGELKEVSAFSLHDDFYKFQLSLSFLPTARLWRFPVETISRSEEGFERTYQGSCILSHWKANLKSGETSEFRIQFEMR